MDEDDTPAEQQQDTEPAAGSAGGSAAGEAGGPAEQPHTAERETGSAEPEAVGADAEQLSEGSVADRPQPGPQPSSQPSAQPSEQAGSEAERSVAADAAATSDGAGPPDEDVPGWSDSDGGGAGDGSGESERRGVPTKALAVGLTVAGLAFAGLAGFFGYQYSQVSGATSNQALVDASATAKVKEDISSAVERVLSYDHSAIEETEQAADELLITDDVRETYNDLYSEVKRIAPEQKMVLKTRVSRLAVIDLDDDRARLLVFVDQSANREGQEDGNVGGSQLAVTAQRQDDQWKIAQLDTYTDQDEDLGRPGSGDESGEGEGNEGQNGGGDEQGNGEQGN